MNTTTLGVTITGDVATLTLTVPALWVLVLLVLSGVFMTYTTTRDWLAGVLARIAQADKRDAQVTAWGGLKVWE
jgi:hypothetical protein